MTVANGKQPRGWGGGVGTALPVVVSSWVIPRKLKLNASAKELTEHQNDHRAQPHHNVSSFPIFSEFPFSRL